MNGQAEQKGLRKLSTFITADALLVAVLLVWAQLWMRFFNDNEPNQLNVGIGLLFTYVAAFIGLFAMLWAGWHSMKEGNNDTPLLSVGLFGSSLMMAIIDMAQSVFSVGIKMFKQNSLQNSLNLSVSLDLSVLEDWFKWSILAYVIIVIVLVGVWFTRASGCRENKGEQWAWTITLLIFVILGLLILIRSAIIF